MAYPTATHHPFDDSSFVDGHHPLAALMIDKDPYATCLLLCHILVVLTYVASTLTGDLSQVDRLWSILPAMYAWICVVDERTALMACLSTLWSIRLTYNFYGRGGYGKWPRLWRGGEEDYRWGVLRSGTLGGRYWTLLTKRWILTAFNLIFVSLLQNYLLLYIASPSLLAWSMATTGGGGGIHDTNTTTRSSTTATISTITTTTNTTTLNVMDYIASLLFVISLLGETVADNQQRAFQNGKKEWTGTRRNNNTITAKRIDVTTTSHPFKEREYEDGFCEFYFIFLIPSSPY
jgi:steroid 5-alpha reductase family enzyme